MTPDERKLKDRVKDLMPRINAICLNIWNPIGAPVPDDEYDSYALRFCRVIIENKPTMQVELAAMLAASEPEITGMPARPKAVAAAAAALAGLGEDVGKGSL